ncbi:competence protein ComG [Anaerobacillus alkalilacustris]|uniref:ComG operon protein 3 n=1 Tax=Anaerobacillus alkalilacustris TaxID=393763 RepID=A0A1S2LGU6_9BACI|nr:competence type IV pilus major pilin ComGC [Anaerobacillus alkalilacustris]OIJ11303.1 competence protein ComG [Anaerobacillus alkalilacustris]
MKIRKYLLNDRAFTLIEMMIVLMIISILLLITVPNMSKNSSIAQERGCEATIDLLQAQVGAYFIENGELPLSLGVLKTEGYVTTIDCPDGTELILNGQGVVVKVND